MKKSRNTAIIEAVFSAYATEIRKVSNYYEKEKGLVILEKLR